MIATWAQRTVDAATRLLACSDALNNVGAGALRIAACLTMAECLIPRCLTTMRSQFPGLDVRMQADEYESVLAGVRAGQIDLGFVGGQVSGTDLDFHAVGLEELVVVVAPDHPWAHRTEPLEPAELSRSQLVLRETGFGSRETINGAVGAMSDEGCHLEFPSTFAIREAVAAGAGPGVLSSMAVARDVRDGSLVRVPVAGLRIGRRLHAVWERNTGLGPAARALIELALRERRSLTDAVAGGKPDHQGRRDGELCPLPIRRRAVMSEASAS
jgi:DNA-binding transcriptional LysR family regulator